MAQNRKVLTLLLVLATACIPIGDNAARLRGRIEISQRAPLHPCVLQLYRASDNTWMGRREVGATFEDTFVLPIEETDFYVTIGCEESAQEFRSPPMRLGSVESYRHGVDLGTVRLLER